MSMFSVFADGVMTIPWRTRPLVFDGALPYPVAYRSYVPGMIGTEYCAVPYGPSSTPASPFVRRSWSWSEVTRVFVAPFTVTVPLTVVTGTSMFKVTGLPGP